MTNDLGTAMVTRSGLASMQVCVPYDWTDEQIVSFANRENPTGIASQWTIRREGDEWLNGDPERNPCEERELHVHVMLDC